MSTTDRDAMWRRAIQRLIDVGPYRAMIADEQKAGARLCKPGSEPWYPASVWPDDCIITRRDDTVRIVAVYTWHRGQGHFRRLIEGITAAGLRPVVVCPIGDVMPAILARWRWQCTIAGRGFFAQEEWTPQKEATP